MSAKNENAAVIGVGVAACAVCCVGPILGVLAAIGVGTAAGFALFGTIAILIGAAAIALVVARRQPAATCSPVEESAPVAVALTGTRTRSSEAPADPPSP